MNPKTAVRSLALFALALGSVALAAGCASGPDVAADGRLTVVATTPHVAELVREVGGDRVEVATLLPGNADPHDYEPRPSDAEAMAGAAAVFAAGGIDEWAHELAEAAGNGRYVELVEAVQTMPMPGHEEREGEVHAGDGHDHGGTDPHWWQDPANAILAAAAIGDELATLDPASADVYAGNVDRFRAGVEEMDGRIAACFDAIPPDRRRIVTTHHSLGYFGHRYGIEIVGAVLPSLTTEAQPSAAEIADLVDRIRDLDVPVVFGEAGIAAAVERAVAEESGIRVGDQLFVDILGPEGTPEATYTGALAANADAIAAGITGRPDGCGLSGS